MYSQPNIESEVIAKLVLGTPLEILETDQLHEISGQNSKEDMVKVRLGDQTGYVIHTCLSKYPPPSFAIKEFYSKGDFLSYYEELLSIGLPIEFKKEERSVMLAFDIGNLQETFSIAQLLLPELLLINDLGEKITLKHQEMDHEQTFGVDAENRSHWNGANVYETSTLTENGDLLDYQFYYRGDHGEAYVDLEKKDGKCILIFTESKAEYIEQ
ncbi:MAG: SH3 domain-containing protein [Bacteroidota bacterium]